MRATPLPEVRRGMRVAPLLQEGTVMRKLRSRCQQQDRTVVCGIQSQVLVQ